MGTILFKEYILAIIINTITELQANLIIPSLISSKRKTMRGTQNSLVSKYGTKVLGHGVDNNTGKYDLQAYEQMGLACCSCK